MAITVKVNNLSLVHRGSDGVSRATLPDVCKTPPDAHPVPYPNVTFSKDLTDGSVTVSADGGNMIAVSSSRFTPSMGDEPGTIGGVKSGVNMKESTWLSYSMDVKIEGLNACRLTDKKLHNRGNTINAGGVLQNNLPKDPCASWNDYDGATIGSSGKNGKDECGCTPGGPPVTPPNCTNTATLQKIVYINGIKGSPGKHCDHIKSIAIRRCAQVQGVYNKSDGFFKDIKQCIKDKLGIGDNPANDKIQSIINDHLNSGEPLTIMAHSQGALITSRAIGDIANHAAANGINLDWSNINIETFGGAAWTYPEGPSYSHTVNVYDFVPELFGKATGDLALGATLGAVAAGPTGAVLGSSIAALSAFKNVKMISKLALNPHDFKDIYLDSIPQASCQCSGSEGR